MRVAVDELKVLPENNLLASRTFLECTFGPTKDGFLVKELMSQIDNELLCKG